MLKVLLVLCAISVFGTEAGRSGRIINGQNATQGQFPYQAGIINVLNDVLSYSCSGAIISKEWVLTSAHCINKANVLIVYSGAVDIADSNLRVEIAPGNYIVHEDYDYKTLANDIGLVFLNPPLMLSEFTKPVVLADEEVNSGTNATVTGWGHSKNDDSEDLTTILQYAVVETLDNSDCQEIYGSSVTDKIVCAIGSNPVKNPCFNDGGAPLVATIDSVPTHVGIFSFLAESGGCEDEGFPAGYTRTASYRKWITEKTGI